MPQLKSIGITHVSQHRGGRRLAPNFDRRESVRAVASNIGQFGEGEASAQIERGRALIGEGHFREAIDAFRRAAAAEPGGGRAAAILGEARAFVEQVVAPREFPPGVRFAVRMAAAHGSLRGLSPVEAFLLSRAAEQPDIMLAATESSMDECDALLGFKRLREDGFLVPV